jgi:hypothetical protein
LTLSIALSKAFDPARPTASRNADLAVLDHPLLAAILAPTALVIFLGVEGLLIGPVYLVQAFRGGLWGLLFGSILFVPLLGAATGAALGALGGAADKADLDEAFRQQVNDELRPDSSMLFLRVDDGARGDEILRRLRTEQFGGKVIRSNLSAEAEGASQAALSRN